MGLLSNPSCQSMSSIGPATSLVALSFVALLMVFQSLVVLFLALRAAPSPLPCEMVMTSLTRLHDRLLSKLPHLASPLGGDVAAPVLSDIATCPCSAKNARLLLARIDALTAALEYSGAPQDPGAPAASQWGSSGTGKGRSALAASSAGASDPAEDSARLGVQGKPSDTSLNSSLSGVPIISRNKTCHMGGIFGTGGRAAADAAASRKLHPAVASHTFGLGAQFMPRGFTPFAEIMCQSTSDKREHYFGHMYGEYLDSMRLQQGEVNLMEIGLRHGDSLNVWLSAFPRGKIYGLDAFYSDPLEHANGASGLQQRVKIFGGDQQNVTLLKEISEQVRAEVGHLDFIVDDGGHTMGQQLASFTTLFPLVRPGGIYFIEDLQTSYWEKRCHYYYNKQRYCYGGGKPGKKNTTIDLMKSLFDVMNADFIEDHYINRRDNAKNLNSGRYKVNPIDRMVGSVQCWRNMCAIRRKYEGSFF